jgi:hypothetical protein
MDPRNPAREFGVLKTAPGKKTLFTNVLCVVRASMTDKALLDRRASADGL